MRDRKDYRKATRDILRNYSYLVTELKNKEIELEHLKENDGISGMRYTEYQGSSTNKITSTVENIAHRNLKEENNLRQEISKLRMNICKIQNVLDILDSTEIEIIKLRYIENKQWDYVADAAGYSRRQAQRIERDAITKITSLLFGTKSFTDLPLFEYLEH